MNQYSLRLGQMEFNYNKSQQDQQLKFYNCYTPILMFCLITFIMNAQDDIIAFIYLLCFSIFIAVEYFYVNKCKPIHVNICLVINNILFSSTLIFIDNGWVLSIITIQLSCHPDFMWNSLTQIAVMTIQIIGNSLRNGFEMVTVNIMLLLLFQIYINHFIIRTKKLYYQSQTYNLFNEKIIEYIDEIFIQFYFNCTTFQFEVKRFNKQADILLNLKDRNNFKEFLKTTTLNQNQLMSLSVKENQNLSLFLYDNYIKNISYFGTTEIEIRIKPNDDVYQLICYSDELMQKEFIFIMKKEKSFQQLDNEIKKQQQIQIFKSQLQKIVDRTYRQVQTLLAYHEQYKAYPVIHMNYKDLYLQIISNTKNLLIIQGLMLFSMTNSQLNQIHKFDIMNAIIKCVELAQPLANYNYKGLEYSIEIKNRKVSSVCWLVEFVIISILYSLLSQEEVTDLELLVKPYQENTILFSFNVYGAQEVVFIKYFTFIKQQTYKAISILGPKSEIALIKDKNNEQKSHRIQFRIYQDLLKINE
ncbi:hypothetical protein pb186bvf_012250 [Paramecium bursaria]